MKDEAAYKGLNDEQIVESREKYGRNELLGEARNNLLQTARNIATEPMFLILSAACAIYFIVKEFSEGFIMFGAMVIVAGISVFQESRTQKALDAVKKLFQSKSTVIRNGRKQKIASSEIVVGDIIIAEEGEQITADALICKAHDFSVDESILTGESEVVNKSETGKDTSIFMGTTVCTGNCIAKVTKIGKGTELGKIGTSVANIATPESPFQKGIKNFIRKMAIIGILAFIMVFLLNFSKTNNILQSILFALVLAMSILPEEIPVAFSSFMALGSWRLLQEKILVKNPLTVETLGSATVICIDKTGTITENKMKVVNVFSNKDLKTYVVDEKNDSLLRIITYAMWASEPSPFDPMEVAIHEAYSFISKQDQREEYDFIHEYPLSGIPPVMTHIYENKSKERIIACKGGIETILDFCQASFDTKARIQKEVEELSSKGLRILGVASSQYSNQPFPDNQKNFDWKFEGLIALQDPPKKNIREVLAKFYSAGIDVKIISGDYPKTVNAIARQIDFRNNQKALTGQEIIKLNDNELSEIVRTHHIYARMFPEAKLRVVNALKRNGEIVAMIGDGVNDGPSLKASDIGIAMGHKGTEIAKQAASIILLDDDLDKMAYSIMAGRKINANLKKAIRYILSIHIPIISIVLFPLLLNWEVVNIFQPIHIVFFELIMGPTCSIIYENEPLGKKIMQIESGKMRKGFLSLGETSLSIIQGLIISAGVLGNYYYMMSLGMDATYIRTISFLSILSANIFLTLVNRSFTYSIFKTLFYKNPSIWIIVGIACILSVIILFVPVINKLFLFEPLAVKDMIKAVMIGFASVAWIEIYKAGRALMHFKSYCL
jgi:P-type Ca2+ transporter type 2C